MCRRLLGTGFLLVALAPAGFGQNRGEPVSYEIVSLREDLRLLTQKVGELSLTIEQINRDNAALRAKADQNYVTLEQLNKAIADVNRTIQAGLADTRRDTLAQVSGQLERLAKQTQAAIDAVAKNQAARPAVQTTFTEDFPKEGINYTVQTGDTLSEIAQKHNSRVQDIVNANKITDPTRIRVGQALFIPQGK